MAIILEGIRDIIELCASGVTRQTITKILWHKKATTLSQFAQLRDIAHTYDIPFDEITTKQLNTLRRTVHSQGVFAYCSLPQYSLESIVQQGTCLVVLDGVQDPGNVGTIIRTAAVLGASGVVLLKGCATLTNPKTLRAIKGYMGAIPFIDNVEFSDLHALLTHHHYHCFAADINGKPYTTVQCTKPVCLFFGSEGNGLSEHILTATQHITIPMTQPGQSLNVAISVGIFLAKYSQFSL